MTRVSRGCEPYLSPCHAAEIVGSGGVIHRNDHLGALVLWPGLRIEQYERLPNGRVELIQRRPDGSIVGLEERESPYYPEGSAIRISTDLIPEAAEDAREAWEYVTAGGFQPSPRDATRILEEAGRRIVEAPPEERAHAVLEALYVVDHLERGDLLPAEEAAGHRARLEAALEFETAGAQP